MYKGEKKQAEHKGDLGQGQRKREQDQQKGDMSQSSTIFHLQGKNMLQNNISRSLFFLKKNQQKLLTFKLC